LCLPVLPALLRGICIVQMRHSVPARRALIQQAAANDALIVIGVEKVLNMWPTLIQRPMSL
jgi:hypothetical protein